MFRRRALMDLDALRSGYETIHMQQSVRSVPGTSLAHADLQTLELTSSDLTPQRFRLSGIDTHSRTVAQGPRGARLCKTHSTASCTQVMYGQRRRLDHLVDG